MDGTVQEKAKQTRGNWVVNIQNEVGAVDVEKEAENWHKHCIYRVPSHMKDLNPKAYVPQVVSFGPYHHGEEHLKPMEEHKRRALLHLLHRCGKPLESFMAAVGEVVEQLMDAYNQLDSEWRDDRERFLGLMVVDGCFMLEIIRSRRANENYGFADNDPIFGFRGMLDTWYFKQDMILMENQLPLLLLQRLEAVETGMTKEDGFIINRMVWNFFYYNDVVPPSMTTLRLHPLDVRREYFLSKRKPTLSSVPRKGVVDEDFAYKARSATELSEAGIRFKRMSSPEDDWFQDGVLSLPPVWVHENTEFYFLNLMAFEQLHNAADLEATSYLFFMARIAKSSKDVALLRSRGIILDLAGDDKSTAEMFHRVSRIAGASGYLGHPIVDVVQRMQEYCGRPWPRWRASIVHTYFRIPGTGYSLAGALLVLGLTVAQVVFAALQYFQAAKS